jgi:ribosomal protein L37AE/L43A
MSELIECPRCHSENVDQFVNDDHLWHCHTCSEMWESGDCMEFIEHTTYPEPMEGVSL